MRVKYVVKVNKKEHLFNSKEEAYDFIASKCLSSQKRFKKNYIRVCTHLVLELDGLADYRRTE